MAPISAAAALLAMAALQLSAAATAAHDPSPAPIGLPGCNTSCGSVSVPYPFGFGPSHCYWPGLNLTCVSSSSSHQPPRLLLGDGSLRVSEISLDNQTVRVMRAGSIINTTGDLTSPAWNASLDFGRGFREHGYLLSLQNELVVSGCNVMATFSADIVGEETSKIVSGCASFCTKSDHEVGFIDDHREVTSKYCTGTSGCCLAPLTSSGVPVPNGVQARWLYSGNHTVEQTTVPVIVFVAEQGWVDREHQADGFEEAPLLLDFGVKLGFPQLQGNSSSDCPQDVQRRLCKSEHSFCNALVQGYTCQCGYGYQGNAYIAGGCQGQLPLHILLVK
jgi:hypothetical protein